MKRQIFWTELSNTRPLLIIGLYIIFRSLKFFIFGLHTGLFILNQGITSLVIQSTWFFFWFFFTTVIIILAFRKYIVIFLFFFLFEYIFLTISLLYYQYFHNYITISQIFHLPEGIQALPTLKIVLKPTSFLFFLVDLPAFILLLFAIFKREIETFLKIKRNIFILSITSISLLCVREFYFLMTKKSIFHFATQTSINEARDISFIVRYYGPLISSFSTIFLLNEEKAIIQLIKYGPEKKFHQKSIHPNIILIQVESLDSSILFIKPNGKFVTPFLNSLTTNSIFAPVVVSYHFGAGATTDADFSILNSLEASPQKPLYNLKTYNFSQALPKLLRKNGYKCLAFHNNDGYYFSRKTALLQMGFDAFYDMADMKLTRKWWGAPDGEMFAYIQNHITNEQQPFFAYIITMSTHGPFEHVLREYGYTNNSYSNWNTDPLIKEYWNAISYVDQELEKFIKFILKHIPSTFIVIIGDHSSGLSGKSYPVSSVHYENERIEIVPFFLIPPQNIILTPKKISYALSHLDISPTILNISGINTTLHTYGDSIFSTNISPIPFLGYQIDRKKLYYLFINSLKETH